ncbi:MAG: hypothetical protein OXG07_05495 [Anaerolineaceae bacterium]|nr:hypothetical protein [Anaerolineaceae bacterium]MCY3906786.1 hypothetical protein [Anaerolineaceae bacterium]
MTSTFVVPGGEVVFQGFNAFRPGKPELFEGHWASAEIRNPVTGGPDVHPSSVSGYTVNASENRARILSAADAVEVGPAGRQWLTKYGFGHVLPGPVLKHHTFPGDWTFAKGD